MQVPLQIKYRYMEPSAILEARIKERCHKLQRFAEYVTSCRVIIDAQHVHQKKAALYRVKIDINLPDGEIITSHCPDQEQAHAHANVNVAIRDAFDVARCQLEDYVRRRRADMKMQGTKLHNMTA